MVSNKTLHIEIKNNVSEKILQMHLKDMFCKHIIKNHSNNKQTKADRLYIESCKIGYSICEWGAHSGHPSDIQYHLKKIKNMERDNYNHAIRIVVCKYDFCNHNIMWVDNLHSAIKYIRQYGINVKLKDIPFYVVDISDYNHPIISGYENSLNNNYEDILGAISCGYARYRRSNLEDLIKVGYTIQEFLYDNPIFL